uniref:Uncharacterized protein n=1 Tax=Rhizophora mucronata TaxID=61149 RepID=A0A2P2IPV7_RHIMU
MIVNEGVHGEVISISTLCIHLFILLIYQTSDVFQHVIVHPHSTSLQIHSIDTRINTLIQLHVFWFTILLSIIGLLTQATSVITSNLLYILLAAP